MKYLQLGDICDVIKGEISITKAISGEYPMVTTAENRKSHNKFQLDTKAVLVPLVSATGHGHASIKRIHYQEGKFAFGSILAACVPKDENYSAKFLYIYFNLMKDLVLVPLMKGSANVSLTLGNLKKAKVPFISLKKQLEIVDLYSRIKIEQDKVLKIYLEQESDIKSLRRAILQEAVQGKLTADWRANNPDTEHASQILNRIQEEKAQLIKEKKLKKTKEKGDILKGEFDVTTPNSWTIAKAVDLGFITKLAGFEYSKYIKLQDVGEVPVIRAQNVKPNRIDERNLKYIDLETSKLLHRCELVKESLLITFIGAGIGDVAVFRKKERWHLAPNVAKLEPFNNFYHNIEIDYLLYYLLSPIGKKQLFKHLKSTAQPSLSMGTIRDTIICLPPIEEQKVIIEKVNYLMDLCDALEQEVQQSQEQSELLMQSVLKEVFEPKEDILNKLIPDIDKYAQVAMATLKMENTFGFKHGKVEKQKTGFLLQAIKKQPIPYKFEKQHFGTFSWELSEDLDKNPYLRKVKAGKGESYEVKSTKYNEVLNLLNAPENASYIQAIDELIQVYQMPQIKGQTEEIELLNTVCKSILDTQSTNLDTIYADMEFWTIKQEGFNSKAEKFSRKRTEKMLELILKLGWDKELIT